MPKFRATVAMTLVTKPVVIEAEDFSDAEKAFRNLSTNELFPLTDSLTITVVGNGIVRCLDTEPISVERHKRKALRGRHPKDD